VKSTIIKAKFEAGSPTCETMNASTRSGQEGKQQQRLLAWKNLVAAV
jgi:hypothetical protein